MDYSLKFYIVKICLKTIIWGKLIIICFGNFEELKNLENNKQFNQVIGFIKRVESDINYKKEGVKMIITSSYILTMLDLNRHFKITGRKMELKQLIGAVIVESRILNPNISVKIYSNEESVEEFNQIRFPDKKRFSVTFHLDSFEKILIFIR